MAKRILSILLVYIPVGFVLLSILLVVFFKWAPVVVTPHMVKRSIENIRNDAIKTRHSWVPLEDISEAMIRAVIVAEDGRFMQHDGFDFIELARAGAEQESGERPVRGCSTISQQTAKNCFTWCTRTWLRKGIEAYYTVHIEKIWGKRRILEVYLNVAEMWPGIYGAEAAAQRYFHIHASELTSADASSLACCLPNPLHRNPDYVNKYMAHKRSLIAYHSGISSVMPSEADNPRTYKYLQNEILKTTRQHRYRYKILYCNLYYHITVTAIAVLPAPVFYVFQRGIHPGADCKTSPHQTPCL